MIEVRPDIATKSGRRMRRLVRGNFPGGGNSGILESWGSDVVGSYFLRLRTTTKPAAPNPSIATVLGSGIAAFLFDGTPPAQAPGV